MTQWAVDKRVGNENKTKTRRPAPIWLAGGLSHNAYRDNVSRITQNALKRFLDARGF